jgi:hypothetical protein
MRKLRVRTSLVPPNGSRFIAEGNDLLLHYARLCIERHRYGVKPNKTGDFSVAMQLL